MDSATAEIVTVENSSPSALGAAANIGAGGSQRTRKQSSFQHIPYLDGLRALAIFWVLTFHSVGPIGRFVANGGGWAGVDAFFVISGFLITGILIQEQNSSGSISLRNFYMRRTLRLLPAYFLFIAVTECVVCAWINPLHHKPVLPAMTMAALYMCDLDVALGWGNIAGTGLELGWSLGVEEKFYLLWPTLIKIFRKHLAAIGCFAMALCFGWRAWLLATGAPVLRISSSIDTKLDALMLGCLASIAIANPHTRQWLQKRFSNPATSIGLFAFLVLYIRTIGHPVAGGSFWQDLVYWDIRVPIFTIAVTLLIVSLQFQPKGLASKFLSSPPMLWIGKISYGIYLWHGIAFVAAGMLAVHGFPAKSRISQELMAYACSVAFAAFSYYLVESPFLRLKERFSARAGGAYSTKIERSRR